MSRRTRAAVSTLLFLLATTAALAFSGAPAQAHGFSTIVFARLSSPSGDVVRADLGLEYDLTEVSVATSEHDDPFYREGQPAWDNGDYPGMVKAVEDHHTSLSKYLLARFHVTSLGRPCTGVLGDTVSVTIRDSVPYANVRVDFTCPKPLGAARGHQLRTVLFPDSEHFVTGTTTQLTYDLDGRSGAVTLANTDPRFSTEQSSGGRFSHFLGGGALKVLTGVEHLLFLAVLVASMRRTRELLAVGGAVVVLAVAGLVAVAGGLLDPPGAAVRVAGYASVVVLAALWWWRSRVDESAGPGRVVGAVAAVLAVAHGTGIGHDLGGADAFAWHRAAATSGAALGAALVMLALLATGWTAVQVVRARRAAAHPPHQPARTRTRSLQGS